MSYLALTDGTAAVPVPYTVDLGLRTAALFEGLPASYYHSLKDFLSFHSLDVLSKGSALECRYRLDAQTKPTQMMIEGGAGHSFLLEGNLDGFGVIPDDLNKRTNAGKAQLAELEAEFGDYLIDEEWVRDLHEIKASYLNHSSVRNIILPHITHVESSIFWKDSELGLYRKSRPDAYCEGQNILVDLKFTSEFSRYSLERTLFNFGYHRQMAHYAEALAAVGKSVESALIVWIKRTRPFDIAVMRIKDEALEAGHNANRANLKTFAGCLESGKWPGAYPSIVEIGLPNWVSEDQ